MECVVTEGHKKTRLLVVHIVRLAGRVVLGRVLFSSAPNVLSLCEVCLCVSGYGVVNRVLEKRFNTQTMLPPTVHNMTLHSLSRFKHHMLVFIFTNIKALRNATTML